MAKELGTGMINYPSVFATTAELDEQEVWLKKRDRSDPTVLAALAVIQDRRQFAPENDRMWAEAEARRAKAVGLTPDEIEALRQDKKAAAAYFKTRFSEPAPCVEVGANKASEQAAQVGSLTPSEIEALRQDKKAAIDYGTVRFGAKSTESDEGN